MQDFKKIDISEQGHDEDALTTTEFTALTTSEPNITEPKLCEPLLITPKKRNISGKYRCPKCQKAYLGRSRMLKHLEDNPDHGPIPEHCKTSSSEVWSFLVDVTQKSPAGRRGLKFCEELSNLLQNLKILARYLFKVSHEKNTVVVDKYLAGALDLAPGKYKFNESELHKDLTIFKMLNDMKLFDDANKAKSSEGRAICKNEITHEPNSVDQMCVGETAMVLERKEDNAKNMSFTVKKENEVMPNNFSSNQDESAVMQNFSAKVPSYPKSNEGTNSKLENSVAAENSISLHSELLSDNSLLNALPNLRCSVDDLILSGVDTTNVSHLLDNSGSSNDAINVDDFVNERLKTINGPDIDLSSSALGLDLPSLDLFHFHHS